MSFTAFLKSVGTQNNKYHFQDVDRTRAEAGKVLRQPNDRYRYAKRMSCLHAHTPHVSVPASKPVFTLSKFI